MPTHRKAVILPFRRRDPDEARPEPDPLARRHERALARLERQRDAIRNRIGPVENVTKLIDSLEQNDSDDARTALPMAYLFRAVRHDLDNDGASALADAMRAVEVGSDNAYVLHTAATLYERHGKRGGVLLLDRAAELAPTDPQIYLDRGEFLADEGDHERALSNFNRVLALDGNCKAAHIARAKSLGALGRHEDAVAACTAAVRLDPNDADLRHTRADYFREAGDIEAAIRDLDRAIKLRPNEAYWVSERAADHFDCGRIERAIVDYTRAMQLEPEESHFPGARGALYLDSTRFDEAIRDLTLAIKLRPSKATYYWRRGVAQAARGDFNAAVADVERAVEKAPDRVKFRVDLGRYLFLAGRKADAFRAIDEGLGRMPGAVPLLLARADMHTRVGDHAAALACLARAVSEQPGEALLHHAYAQGLFKQDEYAEAAAALGPAIELEPESTNYLLLRSLARSLAGDDRGAREDMDHAVALAPNDPEVFLHRGGQLYRKGLRVEALRDLDHAIALDRDHADAYFCRAKVYIDMAQTHARYIANALADLNQAIRKKPESAELYTLRGVVFWMRRSEKAAVVDFSRAIELAPNDPEAWLCRARSRNALGDVQGANADLQRAMELGHPEAADVLRKPPALRWKES